LSLLKQGLYRGKTPVFKGPSDARWHFVLFPTKRRNPSQTNRADGSPRRLCVAFGGRRAANLPGTL